VQHLIRGAIELLVIAVAASDFFRLPEVPPVAGCGLRALSAALAIAFSGRTGPGVARRRSALAHGLALIVVSANEHVSENGTLSSG
jgi:hypothetical protein